MGGAANIFSNLSDILIEPAAQESPDPVTGMMRNIIVRPIQATHVSVSRNCSILGLMCSSPSRPSHIISRPSHIISRPSQNRPFISFSRKLEPEDEEEELAYSEVSATSIFSLKELTILFLLPLSVVLFVLSCAWQCIKFGFGISTVRI